MNKLATIYQRKGLLFVVASHKTEAGFWVADSEIGIVDFGDDVSLKRAIVSALARSQEGVPTPARDAKPSASLLDAAEVTSWRTFAKQAKCVVVNLKDGMLEVSPYKKLGSNGAFEPMAESASRVAENSTDLAACVLTALALAK